MIKKVILVLAAAVTLPFAINAQKFGVVNVESVITAMPDYAKVGEQINEASKRYENEFKKLQEEFDKKYAEFQKLGADEPESIKERRMQELNELAQKMDQFRNTAQQDLQKQQQTLMAPIEQRLVEAIKAVGQEGSYTFILQDNMPAYVGGDVKDITPDVKAKLGITN